jgi:hypothetical protein
LLRTPKLYSLRIKSIKELIGAAKLMVFVYLPKIQADYFNEKGPEYEFGA